MENLLGQGAKKVVGIICFGEHSLKILCFISLIFGEVNNIINALMDQYKKLQVSVGDAHHGRCFLTR